MKIGFIGSGNMARAIARGLASSGRCSPAEIACYSPSGAGARLLAQQIGAKQYDSKLDLIEDSELVVLAFKPQHLESIAAEEAAACGSKLVLSILAGRSLASIHSVFGDQPKNLVRIMPNTPSQIGKGVSTYCFQQEPTAKQERQIGDILSALGSSARIEESQMHVATVLNGCGPAICFRLIQLASSIAADHGLPEKLAAELAQDTAIGALELLKQSGRDPQSLIDEVVSPNGVTHALLVSLERHGLEEALAQATQDAIARSLELSQNS